MQRILVLRGGALGDFLVTLPALAALRRRWPQARIELAGNAAAAALAQRRGLVDTVHSQHDARWSALYASAPLPPEFAGWLDGFDLVVNYWPDADGELAQRFPLHPGQQFLTAAAHPAVNPAARHYADALQSLGVSTDEWLYPLAPLPPVSSPGRRLGITVHPGSGSPRKNWPRDRWLVLLPQLPRPLTLILGEAERGGWEGVELPGVTRLVGEPLETLVAHLAGTALFLGHDSGISHLAASCGAPAVLLFGPTDPARWAPPSPTVRVLRRGTEVAALTLEDVQAAVRAAW